MKTQVVILAGGLATRLGPLTSTCPKSLVMIGDKPFLHHQLDKLRQSGAHNIVLCVGHFGEQIMEHFGDGGRFGVNITYSMEKTPMGTAGALKNAEHLLDETIMTLYGDSYLFLDLDDIESSFARSGKSSLMTVYRNYGRYDRSNTLVRDGQVVSYSKQHTEGMDYIDYGLNVFRKQVLDLIPPDRPYQMEDLFSELVRKNQMAAYEVKERFYEIGSPSGLAEFQRYLEGACK